ncbi:MAG TPA: hypothetical protein VJ755_08605 [Gemmatimonadales bacterium]|nr:hypothetical protein [Gemmatimonadales bacterium]
MKPIIAVIGGSTCTKDELSLALETGRLLAARGAIMVGLHDSFRNAIEIPRASSAEEAVAWALERAQKMVV